MKTKQNNKQKVVSGMGTRDRRNTRIEKCFMGEKRFIECECASNEYILYRNRR
jgi:hypothetical protein